MKQTPAPDYSRPRVGWIKRRARTYMRACSLPRREAVGLAAGDHYAFCHGNYKAALDFQLGDQGSRA